MNMLGKIFRVFDMSWLGEISVTSFIPQTAKTGSDMRERKKNLRDEFKEQNEDKLPKLIKKCKDKEFLKINVIFNLNTDVPNPNSFKKDLDNLLKVLLDIFPEEMDNDKIDEGLGIIRGNEDERVREINCRKEFVNSHKKEGISVKFYEFKEN